MKNAFTLIELIVAIALLGVILLVAATLDVAARKFLNVSERIVGMQCEVSPALLRIKKDINQALGDMIYPGIVIDSNNSSKATFRFRRNKGSDGNFSADDLWAGYNKTGTYINYYSNVSDSSAAWKNYTPGEKISSGVSYFNLSTINNIKGNDSTPLTLQVSITSCYDVSQSIGNCGTTNNPQATLTTSAQALSQPAN